MTSVTTKSFAVAPQWTKKPQSLMKVKEGSLVDIECSARGDPEPVVALFKKQGRAAALVDPLVLTRVVSQFIGDEWTKMTSFQELNSLKKLARSDSGLYKCKAENGVEPAIEAEFEVQVSGTDFSGSAWPMF